MRSVPRFIALLAAASLFTSSASAQWNLLEDFESIPIGDLLNQHGWTSEGDPYPYQVAADPIVGANRALRVNGGNSDVTGANAYLSLGAGAIAEGATGTIFFRMNNGEGDMAFGTSDVAAPGAWGDYEGYMRKIGTNIDIRDGDGFVTGDTYEPGEWTNIWLVLDNDADTTSMYTSTGGGESTFLISGSFRNGTTDALSTLNSRIGAGQEGVDGYIDDIYWASGTELTLPPIDVVEIIDGDVNLDGDVDELDYFVIRDNFRLEVLTRGDGDLTNDGLVDFDDFGQWKANATPEALAVVFGAVPEPSAALIALVGLATPVRWRRN